MNTTGRSAAGIPVGEPVAVVRPDGRRSPRMSMSLWTAARRARAAEEDDVVGAAADRPVMSARASSRNEVVWSPVPEVSVWVLA